MEYIKARNSGYPGFFYADLLNKRTKDESFPQTRDVRIITDYLNAAIEDGMTTYIPGPYITYFNSKTNPVELEYLYTHITNLHAWFELLLVYNWEHENINTIIFDRIEDLTHHMAQYETVENYQRSNFYHTLVSDIAHHLLFVYVGYCLNYINSKIGDIGGVHQLPIFNKVNSIPSVYLRANLLNTLGYPFNQEHKNEMGFYFVQHLIRTSKVDYYKTIISENEASRSVFHQNVRRMLDTPGIETVTEVPYSWFLELNATTNT